MRTLTAAILLIILPNFYFQSVHAQVAVTPSNNALALAQAIVGKGVIISNAKYTGSANSSGFFTNANSTDLGIAKGIVLTTGNSTAVSGPASFFMSSNTGVLGDPDLSALIANATTQNASVLEFDFQAVGDSILVNFVFGSEEYPQYNCSNFNDAFAFLISGPGYTGLQNIALVPNTTIPVAINSINSGIVSPPVGQLATCNGMGAGSPFTNLYVDNTGNQRVSFNGYTKVLTAKAKVTPCVTYHIKLAVADVSDTQFDSGVFIEGESFKSNIVSLSLDAFVSTTSGTFLVEGCKPGTLTMKRLCNDNGTQPLNLELQISGTAVPGVDYTALPKNVTLAAGEFQKTFPIDVVNDFTAEGTESIIIVVKNVNTGEVSNQTNVFVMDQAVFHQNKDDFICIAVGKTLTAQKVDTTTNKYLWSTGATTQAINISQPGTYWVEHEFAQNCFNIDTFKIVNGDPIFSIGRDTMFCAYDSVQLGIAPITGANYLWNTGATVSSISAKDQGLYWLKVTTQNGCYQSDSLLAIHKVVPAITLGNDTSLCAYESFFTTSYFIGATSKWMDGSLEPVRLIDSAGTYFVENELNGCYFRDTIVVSDKIMPVANAGDDITIPRVTAVQLNATRDSAKNASYLWRPNAYLNSATISNPVSFPLNDIMYVLEVQSPDGCVLTDTIKIWIEDLLNIPNVFTPNGDGINDTWIIPLLDTYPRASVEIYNRYGAIVHRSIGYKTPWNGMANASPLPAGTYYYHINPNNGKKIKTGWVQILR